jgi:hypothetical protein
LVGYGYYFTRITIIITTATITIKEKIINLTLLLFKFNKQSCLNFLLLDISLLACETDDEDVSIVSDGLTADREFL